MSSFSGAAWSEAELGSSVRALGVSTLFLAAFDKTVNLLIPVLYFSIGLFIFWRRSDDWMVFLASVSLVSFFSKSDLLAARYPIFAFLNSLEGSLTSSIMFLFFFTFPDGRFVPRWARWAALYTVAVQIWRLFFPGLYQLYAPPLIVPTILAIPIALIFHYRRAASAVQRQQIKWVVYGNSLEAAMLGFYFMVYFLFPQFSFPGPGGLAFFLVGNYIWFGFIILFPLSLGLAILRSRLWDIDILIRRTLVYSLLTALLGLVYFGSVTLLQRLFSFFTSQQSTLSIVLSTLVIAALFTTVRRRLQDFIDRRFYRRKYNAEQALAGFASIARSETDLEKLSERLEQIVSSTVQPERAGLWLKASPADKKENL